MEPTAYERLLDRVRGWAESDPRVRGLVAVGSTGGGTRAPDVWSDHDLLVVTADGADAAVREDPSWLPEAHRIAARFGEPDHGLTLVYEDGHLVELAVCHLDDLGRIPLGEHRVLVGDVEVVAAVAATVRATSDAIERDDADGSLAFHRFVKELVIGVNRLGRGEVLSAHERLRGAAVTRLLAARARTRPLVAAGPASPDGLDPYRRVELVDAAFAAGVLDAVERPLPDVAAALVDLCEDAVVPHLAEDGGRSLAAVRELLARLP